MDFFDIESGEDLQKPGVLSIGLVAKAKSRRHFSFFRSLTDDSVGDEYDVGQNIQMEFVGRESNEHFRSFVKDSETLVTDEGELARAFKAFWSGNEEEMEAPNIKNRWIKMTAALKILFCAGIFLFASGIFAILVVALPLFRFNSTRPITDILTCAAIILLGGCCAVLANHDRWVFLHIICYSSTL